MCLSLGTPKIITFPFVPNGKLMVLGVPIVKHIKLCSLLERVNYPGLLKGSQKSCCPL